MGTSLLALAAAASLLSGDTGPLGPGVLSPPLPLGAGFVPRVAPSDVPKSSRDLVARMTRPSDPKRLKGGKGEVLVLYDEDPNWRWVGELYAQQLTNLLGHFPVKVHRLPLDRYRSGLLGRFDATFYLGLVHGAPIPIELRQDVIASSKPFCWLGNNLWQFSEEKALRARSGIRFVHLDGRGYGRIRYRGVDLAKNVLEPLLARVETDETAQVVATAEGEAGTVPYLVRGAGNFWYVADNPFACVDAYRPDDRLLAFADALHDILSAPCPEFRQAVLRIEDVRPTEDADRLRQIADICFEEGAPFTVSVIPDYRDPNAKWPGGPRRLAMSDAPNFIEALRYMESRGGTILAHGYTHQHEAEANAWSGVSGEEFEFWRVRPDGQWIGPSPEDSRRWVDGRLDRAMNLFREAGLKPRGWVTPHYAASPVAYTEFAKRFDYSLCRGLVFANGPDGSLYGLQQLAPYPVTDVFGMKRYPETLGYLDPSGTQGLATSGEQMAARAGALRAVRDGWAGFYFHPFVDLGHLRTAIRGIKAQGFTFAKPD